MHGCAAVHQSHFCAVPPQIQRRNRRRVLAANDNDVQAKVRVRLVVVVLHLVQVFPGNAEVVRQIVIAGADNQLFGVEYLLTPEAVDGVHGKVAVATAHVVYAVILPHVQAVVLRDLAVILQRLAACGLLVWAAERHPADLQQFRRGEKGHVRRVVKQRVAQAALIHQHHPQTGILRIDGAAQPGWPGTNHKNVEGFVRAHCSGSHSIMMQQAVRQTQSQRHNCWLCQIARLRCVLCQRSRICTRREPERASMTPDVHTIDDVKRAHTEVPIHELIERRWSPRSFADKPLPQADLKSVFTAAGWAASSQNEQPWRFLVGRKGDETYKKLFDSLLPGNQLWAGTAPVLYATLVKKTFALNGKPNGSALHDAGAADATLSLQAQALGPAYTRHGWRRQGSAARVLWRSQ